MPSFLATTRAAVATAFVLALVPMSAAPATAVAGVCDRGVVSDTADVLEDAVVRRAARRLGDDVVVKVITYRDTPGTGDLYAALLDARTDCAGWGFRPGHGGSLLVLAAAVDDRELGSHYDGAALQAFDEARDAAEVDAMGANFGNGAWTQGMVAGLRTYARAHAASISRTPRSDNDETPDNDNGFGGGSVPASADDGDAGGVGAWPVAALAGLLGIGGAAAGGAAARRRLKARALARTELMSATNEMAQAWVDLEESQEFIDARVGTLPDVPDSGVELIRSAHARASTAVEDATARYLSAAQTYDTTVVERMDVDQARAGLGPVRETTSALRTAKQAMTAVEEAVSALEALRAALPGRVAALRTGAADLTRLLEERRSQGYLTGEHDAAPTTAERAAREAEDLCRELRFGDADATVSDAEADLAARTAWLRAIDEFRADLASDTEMLRSRALALDGALAQAYATTEHLEASFHPSCVDGLRARVDSAKADRSRLDGALAAIETNSSMSTQEFRLARQQIVETQDLCDSIAAGASAATAREEQLTMLTAELPLTARRLVAQATAIGDLVDANSAAVSHLTRSPAVAELRAEATALGAEAEQPRAPLLRIEQELDDVAGRLSLERRAVDGIIAEYEAAQRALEAAASAVAEARREVTGADVGPTARAAAGEAEQLLRAAESAEQLTEVHRAAQSARDRANDAVARARRDRREAQARRDAARRQAQRAAAASRSSGTSSWSGNGAGGRGRGGGGGGGSRGIGGGGSRHTGGGGSRRF